MHGLAYIIWNPDPVIFTISLFGLDRPIVWYGLLFALGFIISQQWLYRIFKRDGQDPKDVDILTSYMVIATIIGARLGHCLFYNPSFYLSNPVEILKIWEGGLASHGAGIGIFTAIWIYVNWDIRVKWFFILPIKFSAQKRKKEGQSYWWVLDRLAIMVAMTGALIRTGNFMNSEMEGTLTNSNYGVVYARGTYDALLYDDEQIEDIYFERRAEAAEPGLAPLTVVVEYREGFEPNSATEVFVKGRLRNALRAYPEVVQHIDFGTGNEPLDYTWEKERGRSLLRINGVGKVRHPAQLYEAIFCALLMLALYLTWKSKRSVVPEGHIFAIFMMALWIERFVDEFFKMNQEAFEEFLPINMGQILSIPMFLFGLGVYVYVWRKFKKSNAG